MAYGVTRNLFFFSSYGLLAFTGIVNKRRSVNGLPSKYRRAEWCHTVYSYLIGVCKLIMLMALTRLICIARGQVRGISTAICHR